MGTKSLMCRCCCPNTWTRLLLVSLFLYFCCPAEAATSIAYRGVRSVSTYATAAGASGGARTSYVLFYGTKIDTSSPTTAPSLGIHRRNIRDHSEVVLIHDQRGDFSSFTAIPEQDVLFVATALGIESYSLSEGEYIATQVFAQNQLSCTGENVRLTHDPWRAESEIALYVWTEHCVERLTSASRSMYESVKAFDLTLEVVSRETLERDRVLVQDLALDPAGNLHLLLHSADKGCHIQALRKGESVPRDRFSLSYSSTETTSHSSDDCESFALHFGSATYFVAVPDQGLVACFSALDGLLISRIAVRSSGPIALTTASWNEDLFLYAGQDSVYASDVQLMTSRAVRAYRGAVVKNYRWTDLLTAKEIAPGLLLGKDIHFVPSLFGMADTEASEVDRPNSVSTVFLTAYPTDVATTAAADTAESIASTQATDQNAVDVTVAAAVPETLTDPASVATEQPSVPATTVFTTEEEEPTDSVSETTTETEVAASTQKTHESLLLANDAQASAPETPLQSVQRSRSTGLLSLSTPAMYGIGIVLACTGLVAVIFAAYQRLSRKKTSSPELPRFDGTDDDDGSNAETWENRRGSGPSFFATKPQVSSNSGWRRYATNFIGPVSHKPWFTIVDDPPMLGGTTRPTLLKVTAIPNSTGHESMPTPQRQHSPRANPNQRDAAQSYGFRVDSAGSVFGSAGVVVTVDESGEIQQEIDLNMEPGNDDEDDNSSNRYTNKSSEKVTRAAVSSWRTVAAGTRRAKSVPDTSSRLGLGALWSSSNAKISQTFHSLVNKWRSPSVKQA